MAHRFDRRRLAFESLESRGMLAALIGPLDTAVDCDAPSFDIGSPPVVGDTITVPDVFIPVVDEPRLIDGPADDAWSEPKFVFGPAPEETFATWSVEMPADGVVEPMCFAADAAGGDPPVELPDAGTDDGRQVAFAMRGADLPAPTARGPSAVAIQYQFAAFGFSLAAADGDVARIGWGSVPAKRRTR